LLFALVLTACQSKEKTVETKMASTYFAPDEVIATLNVLVAIIDWPQDTLQQQTNLSIDPELARKLMLPLHPIWDEKIDEVALQMPSWDKDRINALPSVCSQKCECDFYHEVLDRNQAIQELAGVEIRDFADRRPPKTKESILKCLQSMPSIQKVLMYLNKEKQNYESGSVL
jgi:hypothetical protein